MFFRLIVAVLQPLSGQGEKDAVQVVATAFDHQSDKGLQGAVSGQRRMGS